MCSYSSLLHLTATLTAISNSAADLRARSIRRYSERGQHGSSRCPHELPQYTFHGKQPEPRGNGSGSRWEWGARCAETVGEWLYTTNTAAGRWMNGTVSIVFFGSHPVLMFYCIVSGQEAVDSPCKVPYATWWWWRHLSVLDAHHTVHKFL